MLKKPFSEQLEDALDGNPAGHFSRIEPAHAVGEHGNAPISIVAQCSLVVSANLADIAFGDYVHSVPGRIR